MTSGSVVGNSSKTRWLLENALMSSTCLVSHDSHCSCRLYVDFYVNNRKDPLVQRQNQNNLYLLRTNPFPYASTSSSSSPKDYWLLKLEEDFLPEALELCEL
ncbi:hypothetical protein GBA52_028480 [Prunus armeniaca]|nr:hypothetical protein GBA52_028480 [Prunus armeniaca]